MTEPKTRQPGAGQLREDQTNPPESVEPHPASSPDPIVVSDPLLDIDEMIAVLAELDPADSVEPLAEITMALNRELDPSQDRV